MLCRPSVSWVCISETTERIRLKFCIGMEVSNVYCVSQFDGDINKSLQMPDPYRRASEFGPLRKPFDSSEIMSKIQIVAFSLMTKRT